MAQINKKHIWIINTVRRRGKITFSQLNALWQENEDMSYREPLNRQTFIRWCRDISDEFGIIIECDRRNGYVYSILNPDALKDDVTGWLLNTYDTVDTLSSQLTLRDRILVDEVPSSQDFLEDIVKMMKENSVISLSYRGFGKDKAYTFPIEPYCLRLFNRRWYMLGHSVADDRMRLYALDRIEKVERTEDKFRLPEDFDAKNYFASYYGVTLDDTVEVQRVVLRAYYYHKYYIRSLPIHPSQREIPDSDNDESADFELHLRPGFEFCLELLRAGSNIEVLEPQSLRHKMHEWVSEMSEMYKND